jgi:hypothetical protein
MSEFTSYSDAAAKKGVVDPLSRINQIIFFKALGPTVDFLEGEDFHIATTAAKKIMFREHQSTHRFQERKGKAIYERLNNLAPDIAKHFTVKDDPVENMIFRYGLSEKQRICGTTLMLLSATAGAPSTNRPQKVFDTLFQSVH